MTGSDHRWRPALAAVAVAAAVLLASCGGDDDDGANATTTPDVAAPTPHDDATPGGADTVDGSGTPTNDDDEDKDDENEDDKDDDDGEDDVPTDAGPAPDWMSAANATTPACPAPTVRVSTADDLQTALDDAAPGDVIWLEPGIYVGEFVTTASGTDAEPIALCGERDAILDGDGIKGGYAFHLDGAQHWIVDGFTIRNAQKGVMADGTTGTTISRLRVHAIGDEAIHLRRGSTDSVVTGNVISDTGRRRPKFGEGVYIGTAESNFCDISDCRPDPSHRNSIVGNVFFATTSEAIDAKEGTEDGLIAGNLFDGSQITGADSWVDVKGRNWTIEDNAGRHTPADGFQTHEIIDGWGTANTFRDNTGELDDVDGFLVAIRPERQNEVACSNRLLTDIGSATNTDCR